MNNIKQFKKVELQNGSMLYYVPNKITKTTNVDVVFYCGSRCDTIPGLAHFTEHMFFTGTKTLDKKAITKKYFDFINTNACTSHASIYFTGNVFTKEFESYLNTVAEMITESTFTQKAVDDECKVVSQEIAMYKDNYQMHSYYFNDYNLTKFEHLNFGTLGKVETISTIKSKDVKNFVKKYFVKENMDVFVTSPLSLSKVKKIVEKTLINKIPSNPKFKKLPLYKMEVNDDSFYEIKSEKIDKDHLFINFAVKNDPYDMQKRKKIEILSKMLNNQSDGIMNDLRWGDDKNLTYSGRFYVTHCKEDTVLTFNTQCDKENINPIIETLGGYIKRVLKDGFKQEILDFEKREYKYYDDAKEPRLREKFNKLTEFRKYGKIYSPKLLRQYAMDTTLEDCNKMFKEFFEDPRVSLSVYGDATKKDVMSKLQFMKILK